MSVQVTNSTASTQDFFQMQSEMKLDVPESQGAIPLTEGGADSAFLNVLFSMKGTTEGHSASARNDVSYEKISCLAANMRAHNVPMRACISEMASSFDRKSIEPELFGKIAANRDDSKTGRFDPDVILRELYPDISAALNANEVENAPESATLEESPISVADKDEDEREYEDGDGVLDKLQLPAAITYPVILDEERTLAFTGSLQGETLPDLPLPLAGSLQSETPHDLPLPFAGSPQSEDLPDLPLPFTGSPQSETPLDYPLRSEAFSDLQLPFTAPPQSETVRDLPLLEGEADMADVVFDAEDATSANMTKPVKGPAASDVFSDAAIDGSGVSEGEIISTDREIGEKNAVLHVQYAQKEQKNIETPVVSLESWDILENNTPLTGESSLDDADDAGDETPDLAAPLENLSLRPRSEYDARSDGGAAGREDNRANNNGIPERRKPLTRVSSQGTESSREGSSVSEKGGTPLFAAMLADAKETVSGVSSAVRAEANGLSQPGSSYVLKSGDAFGEGLTSVLEFMKNDGTVEARIVVEPPSLGRIDVSLNSNSQGVEATFKVDNEHLKQMLQNQLDALRTSLQAQGIHVSGLAVDIKNRDDQRGRSDFYGAKGKSRRVAGLDANEGDDRDATRILRLDLEQGILHWVA
ncbi:MAG: flagellar hook-length control protein FliK [Synergistaceae bacterium]|jgi:hypothetical protein|nr:flagellar hook-length control protein FliK [Synergistaceae bacterium]